MNKDNTSWVRELSGYVTIVVCECPICHAVYKSPMPIEFANDESVAKLNGRYPIDCDNCTRGAKNG